MGFTKEAAHRSNFKPKSVSPCPLSSWTMKHCNISSSRLMSVLSQLSRRVSNSIGLQYEGFSSIYYWHSEYYATLTAHTLAICNYKYISPYHHLMVLVTILVNQIPLQKHHCGHPTWPTTTVHCFNFHYTTYICWKKCICEQHFPVHDPQPTTENLRLSRLGNITDTAKK